MNLRPRALALTGAVVSLVLGCGMSSRGGCGDDGSASSGAGAAAAGGQIGAAGQGAVVAGGSGGGAGSPDVPDFEDLIIRSSLMSEYDGLTVFATFDTNGGEGSRSEPRSAVISEGAFELTWTQAFDRDYFGAYIVLFVDRAGDGACTPSVDPAWVSFADKLHGPGVPLVVDFDPSSNEPIYGPISCEEFTDWFDEPFGG